MYGIASIFCDSGMSGTCLLHVAWKQFKHIFNECLGDALRANGSLQGIQSNKYTHLLKRLQETLTFSSTASAISECEKDFGLSFWMNLPVISTAIASRFSL